MKKFEAPSINISKFLSENIITTSGEITAQSLAVTGLTTSGSDLLGGNDPLNETSILKFVF